MKRSDGDLSVVGFDNNPLYAEELDPPLTTLELPHYEMGRWAAQHLIEHIRSGSPMPTTVELAACPLVERESVAAPRPR